MALRVRQTYVEEARLVIRKDDGGSSRLQDRSKTGRWLEHGFPRKGWQFVHIEDAGEKHGVCGMCHSAGVRYFHAMANQEAPGLLYVDLRCAEMLEDNCYLPQKREREYRDDLRVSIDWPKRDWKVSRIGNHYINARGFNISIWDKGGAGFGITIKVQNKFDKAYERHGKKLYLTLEEAKAGALVALMHTRKIFRALHS